MKRFIIYLLCLFIVFAVNSKLNAQVCTAKILQNDTAICSGASLQLTVSINDSSDFCNTYSLRSTLQNGLLGWYPFCGNTNDISPNGNNGFATGPLTYTTDRYNNPNTAIQFSGNGESVRTNKIDRTTTNSFSYIVWVNTPNVVTLPAETINPTSGFSVDLATPCVIHAVHGYNWNLNDQHTGAGLYIASNGVFVVEHAASIVATPLSWTGALNGWHSVAVVYDNHTPKLYIDGNFMKNGLATPYTVHPSMACDSFFNAGTYPYLGTGFGKGFNPSVITVPFNNFKGVIDDIKIYNRALTQNEISELYSKDKSSILWSTNDTTRTITTTPLKDTFYSVAVTNSLGTCRDTVNISVKSCSTFSCDSVGIISNDTTVCSGSLLQLNSKNALSYQWSPSTGLSAANIQNPIFTADTTRTYYLTTTNLSDNLVSNGNFEQGNSGFFTNYIYCNTGNCLFPLANNGYSVGTDANFFHNLFAGWDHTTGRGNFMIINGADPTKTVWRETINVAPNTNYAFGCWISTMIAISPSQIRFSINGIQLGPIYNAPSVINSWNQFYITWNSGANATATIEIVNVLNQSNGNDFGLDDIFLGQIVSCTDSIKIKTITTAKTNIAVAICSGKSYKLPSGVVVSATGIYKDTLRSIGGCDSLITTVNLSLLTSVNKTISTVICSGQSYMLPSGTIVHTAGIYNDTIRSIGGCDSIITTVNLSLLNGINKTKSAVICSGQSYVLPSGTIVSSAGIYKDTIRSTSGCDSIITTVSVSLLSPIVKSINVTICNGQTYILPSGNAINVSGVYKDTVKSFSGCDSIITTATLNVIIPQFKNITASVCNGQSYILPSGIVVTTSGIYKDTVKSKSGCDSLITITTLSMTNPVLVSLNPIICLGQPYVLPSGNIVTAAGTYRDTLKSRSGCDSIIIITLNYYPPVSIRLSGPLSVCKGDQALFTAQASGGNGGTYTYSWSPAGSNRNELIISPGADTKIAVSVSDGCTVQAAKDSSFISVYAKPIPAFSVVSKSGCLPVTAQFINNTIPLNNNYAWSFGDHTSGNQISPNHTYTNSGSFTVLLVATNADGCSDSFKIINAVTSVQKPLAAFTTSPDPNPVANSQIDFRNISSGANSFLWDFGDGIGSSTQLSPVYDYKTTGSFRVRLIANNYENCADTIYRIIKIEGGNDIYIPNAFTPNGDRINDYFKISGIGIQSTHMIIYDRWGEKVFEQQGNSVSWDGTNQKGGGICGTGVYVYLISVVDVHGNRRNVRGTVSLLK